MKVPAKSVGFLAAAIVLLCGAIPARAGDVGSDMKKAGKKIGKAAKEFGESVADATEKGAKSAWYETSNWATHESKRVAHATVRWWDDVINEKETKRDKLLEENKELKHKKEKSR